MRIIISNLLQLSADTEASVKNGAELLDRLMKDTVAAKVSSYRYDDGSESDGENETRTSKFPLAKFIPLLTERISVLNPFTRVFLLNWISFLNSVPDTDLIAFLPSFLGGLIVFLSDPLMEVKTLTQNVLREFFNEIVAIAKYRGYVDPNDSDAPSDSDAGSSTFKGDSVLDVDLDVSALCEILIPYLKAPGKYFGETAFI